MTVGLISASVFLGCSLGYADDPVPAKAPDSAPAKAPAAASTATPDSSPAPEAAPPAPPAPWDKPVKDLSAQDKQVRREAALKLGKMGATAKGAVPDLIKALSDSDRQVVSNALTALGNIGPAATEAIQPLIDAMGGGNRGKFRRFDGKQQILVHAADTLSRIGPESIPPLVKALQGDDVSKREGAAMALGEIGASAHDGIPALVTNLGHSDPEMQHAAADALAQIGPESVKPVTEALGASEPRMRQGAAFALAGLGKAAKSAAPKLVEVTQWEADGTTRIALLGALTSVGVAPTNSVPLLIKSLRSTDDAERHAAINGLAAARPADLAVNALQGLLSENDPAIRKQAARTLSRMGSHAAPAVNALIACAKAAPDDTTFTEALSQAGEAALPALLQELSTPAGPEVHQDWVFRTLRDMGSSAMPALIAGLTSSSAPVRAAAVRALGDLPIESPKVVKTVSDLAKDSDADVRAAALRTLSNVRTERDSALPRLEAALNDSAPQVRKAAAAGLVSLGAVGKISVPGLLDLMGDPDTATQTAAVRALGDLGPAAISAVPVLIDKLSNAALQSTAAEALGKIGAPSEPAIPRLLEMARGKDRELQIVSLQAMGAIGQPADQVLPALYDGLKSDDFQLRYVSLQGLAKAETDKDKLLPVLLNALQEQTGGRMRRVAAQSLKTYGDKAQPAIPALIAMLDRDMDRAIALETLRAIHVRDVNPLLTALNHKDANVRAFACESLGDLGPDAKEAVPVLEQKAQGDSEVVRGAAKKALERIQANSTTTAPPPAATPAQ